MTWFHVFLTSVFIWAAIDVWSYLRHRRVVKERDALLSKSAEKLARRKP